MAYPNRLHQSLFQAVLEIKNSQEAAAFFRDLLTIKELDDFATRWQQAQLLYQGNLSYQQIAKKTHTSTTTVTRVAHWLKHGMGGYRLILSRLFPKIK